MLNSYSFKQWHSVKYTMKCCRTAICAELSRVESDKTFRHYSGSIGWDGFSESGLWSRKFMQYNFKFILSHLRRLTIIEYEYSASYFVRKITLNGSYCELKEKNHSLYLFRSHSLYKNHTCARFFRHEKTFWILEDEHLILLPNPM